MTWWPFLVFLGLGWLILVLQSTVMSYIGYGILQPDLLLVLLVHTSVHRRGAAGCALAVLFGYLMDLFSGRPFGTSLVIYVCLYFVIRLLSLRLLLQGRTVQMILVAIFSLVSEVGSTGLARLAAIPSVPRLSLLDMAIRAAINAVVVLALFPVLARIESSVSHKSGPFQVSA